MKLDTLKAMAYTALAAFVAAFVPTALGWLQDAQESVNSGASIPDPSLLGAAALSAGFAALSGLVTGVLAWGRSKSYLPGTPPTYMPLDGNVEG